MFSDIYIHKSNGSGGVYKRTGKLGHNTNEMSIKDLLLVYLKNPSNHPVHLTPLIWKFYLLLKSDNPPFLRQRHRFKFITNTLLF